MAFKLCAVISREEKGGGGGLRLVVGEDEAARQVGRLGEVRSHGRWGGWRCLASCARACVRLFAWAKEGEGTDGWVPPVSGRERGQAGWAN